MLPHWPSNCLIVVALLLVSDGSFFADDRPQVAADEAVGERKHLWEGNLQDGILVCGRASYRPDHVEAHRTIASSLRPSGSEALVDRRG